MRGLIDLQPTVFVGALISLATAFCLGGLIGRHLDPEHDGLKAKQEPDHLPGCRVLL